MVLRHPNQRVLPSLAQMRGTTPMPLDDADLKALQRDMARMVRSRFCYKTLPPAVDYEDLSQVAIMAVLRSKHRTIAPDARMGYECTVGARACIDHLRIVGAKRWQLRERHPRELSLELHVAEDITKMDQLRARGDTEAESQTHHRAMAIIKKAMEVDVRLGLVLYMMVYLDVPDVVIAAAYGLSESWVSLTRSKGLKHVRLNTEWDNRCPQS